MFFRRKKASESPAEETRRKEPARSAAPDLEEDVPPTPLPGGSTTQFLTGEAAPDPAAQGLPGHAGQTRRFRQDWHMAAICGDHHDIHSQPDRD